MRKQLTAIIITILLLLSLTTIAQATTHKKQSKTKTGVKIGIAAGIGAGIGAALGGSRGAAAGALIGGGAMTAHEVARRDSGYGRNSRKVGTIAAGTAVGTGVGAAIGGGKGAGIGALVGGGASALYAFTRPDLKAPKRPEYAGEPTGRQPRYSNNAPNNGDYANNGEYQDPNQDPNYQADQEYNSDPYHRLAGSQGAGIGHLLANGSSAINQ